MAATKTETLERVTFGDRLIRLVFEWRRIDRLLFPSPAEVRFVQLMRGHALTIGFMKDKRTGFPLTLLWRGRLLKNELIEREVWAGKYCLDFATPHAAYCKAIEIDGADFHRDIVREQQRDDYLRAQGWQVMHVEARKIYREPRVVYIETLKFLRS